MLEQGKSVKSPPHEGGGGGALGATAEVPPHAVVLGETGCVPAPHGEPWWKLSPTGQQETLAAAGNKRRNSVPGQTP